MLTVNSTLREIIQANQVERLGTKKIADSLSMGEKKFRYTLKALGFFYDTKLKQWQQEENADGSLLDIPFAQVVENLKNTGNTEEAVQTDSANNNRNTGNTEETESRNTWNTGNINFTNDELLVLKEMIAKHTSTASAATVTTESEDILNALKDAPKGDTTKRTFSLNNNVIGELDEFCDKHRISKSEFVAMAIQDALNKFK